METSVYANRIGSKESPLYCKVNSIKNVAYDSPLVQRIIFENGEIELSVIGNELNISSKQYLGSNNSRVSHKIVKRIAEGYDSRKALYNAKNSIIKRVADLEMGIREINTNNALYDYFRKEMENKKNREELELLEKKRLDNITNEYLKKLAS